MSLVVGDIFEGVYQLEERVSQQDDGLTSRWWADDITAYRRAEVRIDIYPNKYDTQLHWFGDIDGLIKIGQSPQCNCLYFVWKPNDAQSLNPVKVTMLSQEERGRFNDLIDALPIAAHETIYEAEHPQIWRSTSGALLIFFRKHENDLTTPYQTQNIRELWKNQKPFPQEDPTDQLPHSSPDLPSEVANSKGTKWFMLVIGLGILSVLGLYQTIPPKPSSGLISFQRSLANGIAQERKGAYDSALEHFKAAASVPEDLQADAQLDSLATIYLMRARNDCAKFKDAGSPDLYFIPNQYFNYAAVLSRQPSPEICQ
ncbi:hypothetical protein [Persicitalea jodogahamensis]|uniref:Uncharacterized protein n=1 Tax=Persicitalea jodogahamensis TaxID=402147 RepID=A0A8J3GC00_9BACT|nr:hypothetical protein [Persicitalea jodogahamensis]GHB81105.1 hypothetical protein GCM10007390_39760 [Persicitalea jodogahamensis]